MSDEAKPGQAAHLGFQLVAVPRIQALLDLAAAAERIAQLEKQLLEAREEEGW